MPQDLSQVFRPELAEMQAYQAPPVEAKLKLDAMESPFAWPGELQAQWLAYLSQMSLNRYPDSQWAELKQALGEELHLPTTHQLLLGNGSDELIQLICLACARPGACVWVPAPSFSMYQVIANMLGLRLVTTDLTADFALPMDATLATLQREQPALIFLAMPNNPTGNLFAPEVVAAIVEQAAGWVVIDEAYYAFSSSNFAPWLQQHANVMLLRTFSKMGLAGIRLGYLAGPSAAIATINKLRLPYNINTLSAATALFALRHQKLLLQQAEQIKAWRAELFAQLSAHPQIEVWPSQANFLLFRVLEADHDMLAQGFAKARVGLKSLHQTHPLLAGCFRVTIGTAAENQQFFAVLQQLLADQPAA